MKLKLLLTFSILIAFSQMSTAQFRHYQQGYVVTLKGDTLNGFIRHLQHSTIINGIDFKKNQEDSEVYKHYTTADLQSYCFLKNNLKFVSVDYISPNKKSVEKKFGEELVKGKLSLYRLEMLDKGNKKIFDEENDHIYVVKNDTGFIVLREIESIVNEVYEINKDYIPKLKSIINDTELLTMLEDNFNKIMFRDKLIKEIILACNAGKDSSSPKLAKSNYWRKSTVNNFITLGSVNVFSPDAENHNNILMLGYIVDLLNKRANDNYSLMTGVELGTSISKKDNLFLRVPLLATYTFRKKNFDPFINVGTSVSVFQSLVQSSFLFNIGGGTHIKDKIFLSAIYEVDPMNNADRTGNYIKNVLRNYLINIRLGVKLF